MKSTAQLPEPRVEVPLLSSAAEIPGALRQSDGLLLARMSDVTHHPMRSHDNTSAHDILTSNIIIGCKL